MLVVWFFKCVFHLVLFLVTASIFSLYQVLHGFTTLKRKNIRGHKAGSQETLRQSSTYVKKLTRKFTRRLNMAKQQRRQSVAFKQYEEILKTITKPNNKSPLPVKDRRVGARMKKYRQCFLG
jgi:hypothetical protein